MHEWHCRVEGKSKARIWTKAVQYLLGVKLLSWYTTKFEVSYRSFHLFVSRFNIFPLLGTQNSAHPLIQMLLNSNFGYFKQISKPLKFELRKSYILCHFIRTRIIQNFNNSKKILWPLGQKYAC